MNLRSQRLHCFKAIRVASRNLFGELRCSRRLGVVGMGLEGCIDEQNAGRTSLERRLTLDDLLRGSITHDSLSCNISPGCSLPRNSFFIYSLLHIICSLTASFAEPVVTRNPNGPALFRQRTPISIAAPGRLMQRRHPLARNRSLVFTSLHVADLLL